MCGYDICAFNVEDLGLADALAELLGALADIEVCAVETQTYFTAVPQGPLRKPRSLAAVSDQAPAAG